MSGYAARLAVLALGFLVVPLAADAQQAGKVYQIGLFHVGLDHVPPSLEPLRERLNGWSSAEMKQRMTDQRRLANSRIRVLVCDDESHLTEVIEAKLREASYDARATADVREVLQLARAFKPHVALLGVIIPHVGGVQLSQQLFNILPDTKFVLMVEEVSDAILQDLRDKGLACHAFRAPFGPNTLLTLMARLTAEIG